MEFAHLEDAGSERERERETAAAVSKRTVRSAEEAVDANLLGHTPPVPRDWRGLEPAQDIASTVCVTVPPISV